MTTYTVTRESFAAYCEANKNTENSLVSEDENVISYDASGDEDESPFGQLTKLFGCMSPIFVAKAAENGFIVAENEITFSAEALEWVTTTASAVVEEYDGEDDEAPHWDMLELSGDDDADYNGNMPALGTDLLREVVGL